MQQMWINMKENKLTFTWVVVTANEVT